MILALSLSLVQFCRVVVFWFSRILTLILAYSRYLAVRATILKT